RGSRQEYYAASPVALRFLSPVRARGRHHLPRCRGNGAPHQSPHPAGDRSADRTAGTATRAGGASSATNRRREIDSPKGAPLRFRVGTDMQTRVLALCAIVPILLAACETTGSSGSSSNTSSA